MANQKTIDRKIDDQASIPPPPNLKKLFILLNIQCPAVAAWCKDLPWFNPLAVQCAEK